MSGPPSRAVPGGGIPNVPASVASMSANIMYPQPWRSDPETGLYLRDDALLNSFKWFAEKNFTTSETDSVAATCSVHPQMLLIQGWIIQDAKYTGPSNAKLVLSGTYSSRTGDYKTIGGMQVEDMAMISTTAVLIGTRVEPQPFNAGSGDAKLPLETPERRSAGIKREVKPEWMNNKPESFDTKEEADEHFRGALRGDHDFDQYQSTDRPDGPPLIQSVPVADMSSATSVAGALPGTTNTSPPMPVSSASAHDPARDPARDLATAAHGALPPSGTTGAAAPIFAHAPIDLVNGEGFGHQDQGFQSQDQDGTIRDGTNVRIADTPDSFRTGNGANVSMSSPVEERDATAVQGNTQYFNMATGTTPAPDRATTTDTEQSDWYSMRNNHVPPRESSDVPKASQPHVPLRESSDVPKTSQPQLRQRQRQPKFRPQDSHPQTSASASAALPRPRQCWRPGAARDDPLVPPIYAGAAQDESRASAASATSQQQPGSNASPIRITQIHHVSGSNAQHRQGPMSTIVEEALPFPVSSPTASAETLSDQEIARQLQELENEAAEVERRGRQCESQLEEEFHYARRCANLNVLEKRRREVEASKLRLENFQKQVEEARRDPNFGTDVSELASLDGPVARRASCAHTTRSQIDHVQPSLPQALESPDTAAAEIQRLRDNLSKMDMDLQQRDNKIRDLQSRRVDDHNPERPPASPDLRQLSLAADHVDATRHQYDFWAEKENDDPYGPNAGTSARERHTLKQLGALLEKQRNDPDAQSDPMPQAAPSRKNHEQLHPLDDHQLTTFIRNKPTNTTMGFAVHEAAAREFVDRDKILPLTIQDRKVAYAGIPGDIRYTLPELRPAYSPRATPADTELVPREMAAALIKLAAQHSQQNGKVSAPKCELLSYKNKPAQLPSMMNAYLIALWKYVGLATGNMELAVHLLRVTHNEFKRLVYLPMVDWASESPIMDVPEHLNRTAHQSAEVIVQNIIKGGTGDSKCQALAAGWITQYATDNMTMEEALCQSPWTDLGAYVIHLKLEYDNIVLRQDDLQKAIQKPSLNVRTITEDLSTWNQALVLLTKHDPTAAHFCTRTGVPYIHERLLELYRSDTMRSMQLVQAAQDFGIKMLNCDHKQYVKYVLDVRAKVAPTLLEKRDNPAKYGTGTGAPGTSGASARGPARNGASRCIKEVFGMCNDVNCRFSHDRNADFPPRFLDMAKAIIVNNPHLEIKPWMRKKDSESKAKRANVARANQALIQSQDTKHVVPNDNFGMPAAHVFKGDFDQDAWLSDDDDLFSDAQSQDVPFQVAQSPVTVAVADAPVRDSVTDTDLVFCPVASIDDGTDIGDVCINQEIVLHNGFFVSCKALTPTPEQKEKECAAYHGMGFCPFEMMYKKCEFKHYENKRKMYLNVYCDPKKCRFRAACPKNHSKDPRADIVVDWKPTANRAHMNLHLQSDIAAGWDMSAMVATMKNKDGPWADLVHVKVMFSVSQLDGSSLADTGANGQVLDARDPRVLRVSDDTIPLHTSDGSAGFQRIGTARVPFHNRKSGKTHSRDAPPLLETWTRAPAIIVNVDNPTKEFSAAILPAAWIGHFTMPGATNFEFRRHAKDQLQPHVSQTSAFASLDTQDVAMYWHNRLPYLAPAEVISYDGGDTDLHPLPWTALWTPPKLSKDIDRSEHDCLFNELFRCGPEVPKSPAPGRV